MLKCVTFGCFEKAFNRSKTCQDILLCEGCCFTHLKKHLEDNSQCVLEKIELKLSENQREKLRNKIEEAIKAIEVQRKKLQKKLLKHQPNRDMVMLSFNELKKITEKYSKFTIKLCFQRVIILKFMLSLRKS